jgi:predicted transcriptional regulator
LVKHRNRLDIVADVLKAAKNNGKKTRIMYLSNLSHLLVERYLAELLDVGLVSFVERTYQITEKGEAFLEKYTSFLSRYLELNEKFQGLTTEKKRLEKMCSGR